MRRLKGMFPVIVILLVIPFCTSGGSDIEETMPTFLDSCQELAVYGERRISSSSDVESWLEELGLGL